VIASMQRITAPTMAAGATNALAGAREWHLCVSHFARYRRGAASHRLAGCSFESDGEPKAAVTRQTLDGKHPNGWVPEQKISLEEAIHAYTLVQPSRSFRKK